MRQLGVLAAAMVLALTTAAQAAPQDAFDSGLRAMGLPRTAVVKVGFSDWFKTPADKATDADKLEFLRGEGEPVDSGYFTLSNGAVKLTDKGAAVFNRMKPVFNEQLRLLSAGYQRIEPAQARVLQVIEGSVNLDIRRMRESCKDFERLMSGNQYAFSFTCNFVTDVAYVARSGRSYFASRKGQDLLQALSQ